MPSIDIIAAAASSQPSESLLPFSQSPQLAQSPQPPSRRAHHKRWRVWGLAATVALLGMALSACQRAPADDSQASNAPLPVIEVVDAVRQPIATWHQYTTRLEAPERVTVRPRVSGQIDEIMFTEGASVDAGDLLVVLDPAPFEANIRELEAQLERGRAELAQAQGEANRASQLVGRNLMSREEAEARHSNSRALGAQLLALEAQLDSARLDLDHSRLRAPISGQISNAQLTEGNLVTSGESILTTLVSTSAVDAYFDIDERTWNRDFAQLSATTGWPVELQLAGQDDFAFDGRLDFIDNRVDADTGTLRVRARFSADHASLRPGAFARLRIAAARQKPGVLVPDRAVGTDLDSRFVLTVDDNGLVNYSPVTVGSRFGAWREITSGLQGGEQVVAAGPAKLRPGMTVDASEVPGPDSESLSQLAERTQRLASQLRDAPSLAQDEAVAATSHGGRS
ncbi:efflux RND transporter periplasmic adaptor subunit [Halomonas huangheensis]|nr:efflux RND transporter periplasmic adaptor subunit [Halomonas huangheensis]